MKYAILSDVHANLQALEAVLKDARQMGAETYVSLGDTVGYGPQPAEALARVRKICAIALAGNHDDAVSGRTDAENFIDLAADAVQRHRDALDREARDWLRSLPYTAEIEGAVCTHGDLVAPAKFYYVEDEADAAANFQAADFQLAFVGHSHRPALFVTGASGKAYKTDPQDFTLEDGKRYIVNPGSVGYPRESNGVCLSSYVIYDSTVQTVEYRFLPFAVSSVLQRGHEEKAPAPKTRWKLLAALGAFALAAAAAFLVLRPVPPAAVSRAAQGPATVRADESALVVTNRTLILTTRIRELRANLRLARDSAPVRLRVRFFDARGCAIGPDNEMSVRHTLTRNLIDRNHAVPDEARSVRLTVLKTKAADAASIDRFDPTLSE